MAAPDDIVAILALGEVGKLGRFFAVIEELIEWNFEGAGQFLKRFDGRNSVAIFNAGDVATKKSRALFDVPLGELFFFAQGAKSVAYNHVANYAYGLSACKLKIDGAQKIRKI